MTKIIRYSDFESFDNTISLPSDIIEISNAYISAGKEIFLVGGAVRDFIQGLVPKDYDLVTNALPDESKNILKDFNVSDEQGKNFGVLRVYTSNEPEGYEIASYRIDISGGRDTRGSDKKVEIGSSVTMKDDCLRRDLTINSLYYCIKTKKIIDLVGGVSDIKGGTIKAVGDASQRFIEDRLRICRVFRFAARVGGNIDKETSIAIKADNRLKGISLKDDVSQERIWEEIKKAWSQAKDFNHYLTLLTEYKMWDEIFKGANINTDLIDSNDFLVVIANLFKNEKTTGLFRKMVNEYKIDGGTAKKIIFLIDLVDFKPDMVFDFWKRKQQCGIVNNTINEWLDAIDSDNKWSKKFINYTPSVSSKSLIDIGIGGAELGAEIKRLEIKKFSKN
jgi:poly(A) polymerase